MPSSEFNRPPYLGRPPRSAPMESPEVQGREKTSFSDLRERFSEFSTRLAGAEEIIAANFLHNPKATLSDARQYRSLLHFLLFVADDLVTEFEYIQQPSATAPYIAFLNAQIERHQRLFEYWFASFEGSVGTVEVLQRAIQKLRHQRLYGDPSERGG